MKQNRWFRYIGIAAFALVLSAIGAPAAQALTVNAFVVRQSCVNGDIVAVTLSATVQPNQRVRYRWDFNNDGIFDTPLLLNPTVTHRYADEVRRTARVRVLNANGVRAVDTVTFMTRRCGGGGG
jgi:PKD domain